MRNELIGPVVKWLGGKRQLLPDIAKLIPEYGAYYEPFVGGGAVFFHVRPDKAVINDVNRELINLYQVLKDDVDGLIADLQRHKNESDYFYSIREIDRDKTAYGELSPVQRASRTIFLNKTCFNGLFRVNKAGEFNSPFGKYKNPNIVNERALRAVSGYFRAAKIRFLCSDFVDGLEGVEAGDFVYLDPPYDPLSSSANFTGYNQGGFNRQEQIRLKETCDWLAQRGVKFLLSNSATDFIKELYQGYRIENLKAKRVINSKGDRRGGVDEILVRNYC